MFHVFFFNIFFYVQITGNGSMNIKQTRQITYDLLTKRFHDFFSIICCCFQITLQETEVWISEELSIFTIFFFNLFFFQITLQKTEVWISDKPSVFTIFSIFFFSSNFAGNGSVNIGTSSAGQLGRDPSGSANYRSHIVRLNSIEPNTVMFSTKDYPILSDVRDTCFHDFFSNV